MNEHPLAKKIRKAGGTVISRPLFRKDGEIDEETADILLDELEKKPHQTDKFNPEFDK